MIYNIICIFNGHKIKKTTYRVIVAKEKPIFSPRVCVCVSRVIVKTPKNSNKISYECVYVLER